MSEYTSNGDERFHAAIRHTCISIHGYGRLGGGYGGKDWAILGGHNDEVGNFFFSLPVADLPWFGVFILLFVSHGERMRLYLCQSQRPVKKFMRFQFCFMIQPSLSFLRLDKSLLLKDVTLHFCVFLFPSVLCLIRYPQPLIGRTPVHMLPNSVSASSFPFHSVSVCRLY